MLNVPDVVPLLPFPAECSQLGSYECIVKAWAHPTGRYYDYVSAVLAEWPETSQGIVMDSRRFWAEYPAMVAVSYTHLTLPTICSV